PATVVTLRGPDGTTVLFKGSLDAFRGHSAAGVWTLAVTVATSDSPPATLVSWNLRIQFAGDQRLAARPNASGSRRTIAAVAHAPGAHGTNFVSDVRLLNRGTSPEEVMVIFTPRVDRAVPDRRSRRRGAECDAVRGDRPARDRRRIGLDRRQQPDLHPGPFG